MQETRIQQIPLDILDRKIKNAKGSPFKLASLQSVSEHELLERFGQAGLEAVLAKREALPKTLEGQTEEQLKELYPLLKISVACATGDPEKLEAIGQLFNQEAIEQLFNQPYGSNFNRARLWSLCSNRYPTARYDWLSQCLLLFKPLHVAEKTLPQPCYQPRDIIARDFLLAGEKVGSIINFYLFPDPQKKDLAIQIIQWCCDNNWEIKSYRGFVDVAVRLKKPELTFKIVRKLTEIPNTTLDPSHKIDAFIQFASEEGVKEQIREFAQELYTQGFDVRRGYESNTLRLYLKTGIIRNDGRFQHALTNLLTTFQQTLAQMFNEPTSFFRGAQHPWDQNAFLVRDLITHGFKEEAKAFVQHAVTYYPTLQQQEMMSPIYLLSLLVNSVSRLNEADFISALNDKLKEERKSLPNNAGYQKKISLIKFIASLNKDETEQTYLMDQATLLHDAWKADNGDKISLSRLKPGFPSIYFYLELSTVYFHLNQRDLCQLHFHNYINKLQGENEVDIAYHLQEMGLEFNSLEDLKSYDPFEIIKLNLQKLIS